MAYRYLVECSTKPCGDYGTNDYRFKNANVVKIWPNQNVFSTGELLAMECKAKSEGKEEGQNEAWELAQKILKLPGMGGYTDQELCEIFGIGAVPVISDLIRRRTYQEVADKVKKWEDDKVKKWEETANICVGDVLVSPANFKALVTCIEPDWMHLLYSDGSCGRVPMDDIKEFYKKTGQRFDLTTIGDLLKEEE